MKPQDYFNSIKVQLERLMPQKLKNLEIFQFHKGTIRTATNKSDSMSTNDISIP